MALEVTEVAVNTRREDEIYREDTSQRGRLEIQSRRLSMRVDLNHTPDISH